MTSITVDDGLATHMADVARLVTQARQASLVDVAGVELVHDVRVALRRCRSLAQGLAAVDACERKAWRTLSATGRPLFAGLGALRDLQVIRGFIVELVDGAVRDDAVARLDVLIAARVEGARAAIAAFDDVVWADLRTTAPARATTMLRRRPALLWLAVTRFNEARALHVTAMRSRTSSALHDVRIGVKRLRYTLESLLPEQHARVQKPLKRLQDTLGELHDLDVALGALGRTATARAAQPVAAIEEDLGVIADDVSVKRLVDARAALLAAYKATATGRASVWTTLRAVLPTESQALARCERAAVLEEAAAIGIDGRTARRAEAAARAIARAMSAPLTHAQRLAVLLAPARRRRRRRAAKRLLGVSDDTRREVRRALRSDPLIRVVRAAVDISHPPGCE